jgi:hypothetical protein
MQKQGASAAAAAFMMMSQAGVYPLWVHLHKTMPKCGKIGAALINSQLWCYFFCWS